MYDYDAVDLLDLQRNPHRNDHIRAYEYDLRKIQEIIPSNIHTRSSVYLEIHLDLSRKIRITIIPGLTGDLIPIAKP